MSTIFSNTPKTQHESPIGHRLREHTVRGSKADKFVRGVEFLPNVVARAGVEAERRKRAIRDGYAGVTPPGSSTPYIDTFLALLDTPDTYTGQTLKGVRVNAGETALEFASAGGFSAIQTYEPSWTSEKWGVAPTAYPAGALTQVTPGNTVRSGKYKYNDDYLHLWIQFLFGTTFVQGNGRWVIGLPGGFSPPANARGVQGKCIGGIVDSTGGDGTVTGAAAGSKLFTGISVYGGLPYSMPTTLDGTTVIKTQGTTGIYMFSRDDAANDFDFWGDLPGGGGLPFPWVYLDADSTFFELDILIPQR